MFFLQKICFFKKIIIQQLTPMQVDISKLSLLKQVLLASPRFLTSKIPAYLFTTLAVVQIINFFYKIDIQVEPTERKFGSLFKKPEQPKIIETSIIEIIKPKRLPQRDFRSVLNFDYYQQKLINEQMKKNKLKHEQKVERE